MTADTPKTPAPLTEYRIERQVEFKPSAAASVETAWVFVGYEEANSADAALRNRATADAEELQAERGIVLRAIASSRITERAIKIRVERRVELG